MTIFAKRSILDPWQGSKYAYVILNGIRTIAAEENCPPVKVRVWFRDSVRSKVEGQFSSGAIIIEPWKVIEIIILSFDHCAGCKYLLVLRWY